MLNSLPLIIVIISSLFLAFYCVDSHKENIVTTLNIDEKSMEPVSVKLEENLTKQEVRNIESVEEVYVEVLAVEDTNESSKIVEKTEDKSVSEVVVEDSKPTAVEVDIKEVEVTPIIEPKIESKPKEVQIEEVEKTINEEEISEYSEGYKLDDLEKMIMEELKKGNKD